MVVSVPAGGRTTVPHALSNASGSDGSLSRSASHATTATTTTVITAPITTAPAPHALLVGHQPGLPTP